MSALCIIMTGELRNFFDKRILDSYIQTFDLCKLRYTHILIICVINGAYDKFLLGNFFTTCNLKYVLIEYDITEFNNLMNNKKNNKCYIELRNEYINNTNNNAHNELSDPNNHCNYFIPFHQLQIGLIHLLEYEKQNNIIFDVIMKTRFNMKMKDMFYPHLPSDLIYKICFNNDFLQAFVDKLKELNIELNFNKVAEYISTCNIKPPECRVDYRLLKISFSGMYAYNNTPLLNILNGSDNILYAFNDFIYFSKRNVMLKLINLFNDAGEKRAPVYMPHFYAPEAQLYLYCINNDIDMLMYTELNDNGFGYKYGAG